MKLKPLKWNNRTTDNTMVHSASSPLHSYDICYDKTEELYRINIYSYRTSKSSIKFKRTLEDAKQWCTSEHYELKVKDMFEQ